jgi:hypothetical protein
MEHYIAIGHNTLDEFVFLIQCHVANVVTEFAFPASVASLVTLVTG